MFLCIPSFRRLGSLSVFALFATFLIGQQSNNWDSLYSAIPDKPDSLRFEQLYALSLKLAFSDKEYFLKVTDEASVIADRLESKAYGQAKVFDAFARYHTVFGTLDSSVWYWDRAMSLMDQDNNRGLFARYKNNIGIIKRRQGDYDAALKVHLESFAVFEELGDSASIYRVHNALGGVYSLLNEEGKAIFHFQKMLDNAIRNNDLLYQADGYTNIGTVSSDSELSISNFEKAIPIYRQLDKKSALIGTILKVAKEYSGQGRYRKEIEMYDQAEPIVKELNSKLYEADLLRGRGRAMLNLQRFDEAISNLEKAKIAYKKIGEMEDEVMTYRFLYQAQAGAGRYKDAFESKSRHALLTDSTKSIEVLANISELETKYETAKKEAKIVFLEKESELDETRQKALWGGIGMLILLGSGISYGQYQRRKREQEVARKEKEIEVHKRQVAEQELVFKKKELTAKALQLASKNEFLSSLEEEVSRLSSSIDGSITTATSRISRMIKSDSDDEDEWRQFSKEFTSVHQDFVDRLVEKYGSFTSGEMRLVSLLKMNLSTKEIANILRVSDEGIKKARYRLRKKLGLASGDDLAAIILAI